MHRQISIRSLRHRSPRHSANDVVCLSHTPWSPRFSAFMAVVLGLTTQVLDRLLIGSMRLTPPSRVAHPFGLRYALPTAPLPCPRPFSPPTPSLCSLSACPAGPTTA